MGNPKLKLYIYWIGIHTLYTWVRITEYTFSKQKLGIHFGYTRVLFGNVPIHTCMVSLIRKHLFSGKKLKAYVFLLLLLKILMLFLLSCGFFPYLSVCKFNLKFLFTYSNLKFFKNPVRVLGTGTYLYIHAACYIVY